MEIIQAVESKVLQLAETVLEGINGESTFSEIQESLKKELNQVGVSLLKEVLEGLDKKIYKERSARKGYHVSKRDQKNTVVTLFGAMEYQRNYYRDKATGGHVYLADEQVGITPHMRVDPSVKAELLEDASHISYERATEQFEKNSGVKLSRQTVAKTVKSFPRHKPEPDLKKQLKKLYIECDEDHISCRNKPNLQARLIYIHEGYLGSKKRPVLKNAHHFTTVNLSPLSFWFEVCDYIASHYDLFYLEEVFISGDGANWIRTGKEVIPDNTFVLDRFHLAKYITAATAHVKGLKSKVYKQIEELNLPGIVDHLKVAIDLADTGARQKRIKETIRYIKNNWDGIKASVEHPEITCSAEGHVSHVLSARMSSRPMAWSVKGAEKMAHMRAVKANKENIKELYLKERPKEQPLLVLKEEAEKQLRKLKNRKSYGQERRSNVPLSQGGFNLTREVINHLKNNYAV